MERQEFIASLNERFATASPQEMLQFLLNYYEDKIALASSLGPEDQILTAMLTEINPKAKIFTLDTGRLFPETLRLLDRTNKKYAISIQVFFPDYKLVEEMVNRDGINSFYDSIEKRQLCCRIRKLEPLKRAFQGLEAWICGLRKEQSVTRHNLQLVEWDEVNNLIKFNPLMDWTEQQVWEYINQNQIHYNRLHDQGYPSIGCEPCTRSIEPGENIRAGRWWWESPDHKECGLHKRW